MTDLHEAERLSYQFLAQVFGYHETDADGGFERLTELLRLRHDLDLIIGTYPSDTGNEISGD